MIKIFKRETHLLRTHRPDNSKLYIRLVLGTILLALGVGEWIVRSFIVPIPSTTPNQIYLIYTGTNSDIALGDSQIYRAFIANDDFLDLGLGGTTIPMMKIVAEQYFKYREPGRIIIEVSPQLLSEDYLHRDTQGYEGYFNQNYPLPIKIYILEPGIGSWIKNINSMDDFSRLIEDRKEGIMDLTVKGNWKKIDAQDRLIRTRNRVRKQEPDILASQEAVITYEEMIGYLVERGADVCMFRTPVDETYLETIDANPSFAKSLEIFQNIAIEYGVPYVDFQDLNYSFSLDKFINQDHITPIASADIAPLIYSACFGE